MAETAIEWTLRPGTVGAVLNPTTGCDRISPGCDNCYALTMAKRLKAMGQPKYQQDGDPRTSGPGFGLTMHEDVLEVPLPSLDLTGIDQILIGGESGPGARQMDLGWVRELIAQARDAGTTVFMKQLGSVWARRNYVHNVDPKGGNWDFWPTFLRVREFPEVAR